MLLQEEKIAYCKACKHQRLSEGVGIVCGLTKQPANFEFQCPDYIEVPRLVERKESNVPKSDVLNWKNIEPEEEKWFSEPIKSSKPRETIVKEIRGGRRKPIRWWNIDRNESHDISRSIKFVYAKFENYEKFLIYIYPLGAILLSYLFFRNSPIILFLIIAVVLIYSVLKHLKRKKFQYLCFELNRETGIVKIPDDNGKVRYVIPFSLVQFVVYVYGVGLGGTSKPLLAILSPNKDEESYVVPFLEDLAMTEARSLIIWYMDKNRPLPPGREFDKYRQADFERRRAEGFPPPLYPASIETPEATTAHQLERKKYWKDKDYMIP